MPLSSPTQPVDRTRRQRQIFAAQVRLLYANANTGVAANLIATAVLGRLEWDVVSHATVLVWALYTALVSAVRYTLVLRYRRAGTPNREPRRWGVRFAVGAGLAGAGWGAAGVLLYPEAHLAHQIFLAFILGGMMLGAASLLAPRIEVFLAFIVPPGLAPALRFLAQGGQEHIAMGLMAALFTVVTLITTWRIHQTILSSLDLQFENHDLVEDLRNAKEVAEALNERLEVRVEERTAKLRDAAEQLRAEIAQREKIEEELLRARKLESLGVLAGGIAHDFNNFLTVVRGNVELAALQLPEDDPVSLILGRISSAGVRATFLASQLLTFAKGGAPVRRLISLAALIADAVHLARAGAPTTVDVKIAGDLHCAEADPGQMEQALHNILLNAREASPDGGIVEVRAANCDDARGPRVSISIRDYGCGIAADTLPLIFDPYFTTKSGASGLGLATAYAIAEKHGGRLSVESQPGRGSVFTLELPASHRAVSNPGEPQSAAAPPTGIAAPLSRGVQRVLVMDDEPDLRNLLQAVLSRFGYEVQLAGDGAEAIALCETAKSTGRGFDAALLDLTVRGGMGGAEAAPKLKEIDPGMRLIVSSGYSGAPVMAEFRKYGFDAMIPKPWVVAEIRDTFLKLLPVDREAKPKCG